MLRDAVLHLLEDDPTLEPRDVIVMCPDIENFAPLIQATFGAHDLDDGPHDSKRQLEIRLADRSLRHTNPVMGVLAEVLDLATARITATQVLDLAGREPVRRRFGFRDDDLFRLEEWVRSALVRWGFDAAHRSTFRLGDIDANTWRSGLDRILLGVTMADDRQRLFGDALPLDDVDSGDIELAGRLAEFLDRLQRVLDDLRGPGTVRAGRRPWPASSDALTRTSPRDLWQRAQLTELLEGRWSGGDGRARQSRVVLSCDDVRVDPDRSPQGQPTRANFRTGHLTVCTLVPMRSIPHRVVCLLGLDDGSFPRHIERDGDDLTARSTPASATATCAARTASCSSTHCSRHGTTWSSPTPGRDERSNLPPPAGRAGRRVARRGRRHRPRRRRDWRATPSSSPTPCSRSTRATTSRRTGARAPWSFDTVHLAGARPAADAERGRGAVPVRPAAVAK